LEEAGKCGKHRARLRGWRATESNGDASQMLCVPDGTKGYTAAVLLLRILNTENNKKDLL
jgi:hypothetical protein